MNSLISLLWQIFVECILYTSQKSQPIGVPLPTAATLIMHLFIGFSFLPIHFLCPLVPPSVFISQINHLHLQSLSWTLLAGQNKCRQHQLRSLFFPKCSDVNESFSNAPFSNLRPKLPKLVMVCSPPPWPGEGEEAGGEVVQQPANIQECASICRCLLQLSREGSEFRNGLLR